MLIAIIVLLKHQYVYKYNQSMNSIEIPDFNHKIQHGYKKNICIRYKMYFSQNFFRNGGSMS